MGNGLKLSETAKNVIEIMIPGRKYSALEIAAKLGMAPGTIGMQLRRMWKRGHLDRHDTRQLWLYSLPGTVTAVPAPPASEGRHLVASNLGQIIGRLMWGQS